MNETWLFVGLLSLAFAAYLAVLVRVLSSPGEGNLPRPQVDALPIPAWRFALEVGSQTIPLLSLSCKAEKTGRIVARPARTTLWRERRWTPRGNSLVGYYRCAFGAAQGHIDGFKTRTPRFFIKDPPPQLDEHEHRACFQPQGDGWFFVHFGVRPTDPDSGIRSIEEILYEVLDPQRRTA